MSDTTAPILHGISLDRTNVAISGAPEVITVSINLSDAGGSKLSTGMDGNAPNQVRFFSHSGQFVDAVFYIPAGKSSGTFEADMTLGKFAEAGDWTVSYAYLHDNAGNQRFLEPSQPDSLLAGLKFTVTNPQSDAVAPEVKSISLNRSVVDFDAGQKTVVVTARITDSLAGVFTKQINAEYTPPQIVFISPSGQYVFGMFNDKDPDAGNAFDDVYTATLKLEESAEPGEWKVQALYVSDKAGNLAGVDRVVGGVDDLTFTVKNGLGDSGPPTVDWIAFGEPTLKSNGTSQFVVEARLTDDKSGLSDGTTAGGIGFAPPQVRFASDSGQSVDGIFDIADPISGTVKDGVFRAVVTLSAFAETGVWRVEHLLLSDEAGNIKYYRPEDTPQIPTDAIHLGTDLPDTIAGTPQEESIYGYGGDDTLDGASGDDTLSGGGGDDSVDGGDGDDTIVGGHGAGDDTYLGGAGFDRVTYTSAGKKIVVDLQKGKASGADIDTDKLKQIEGVLGGRAGDTIKGSKGANVIDGHTGKDKLTGDKGKDTFLFSTEPGKKNVDTITDFNRKDDTIALDASVFSGLEAGKLEKADFVVGRKARDKDDRIVHDDKKGVLIYDDNGSAKGGAAAFAKIGKGVAIGADDFIIV